MPELPEVETITARLRPVLLNKQIISVEELHPKPFQGNSESILNQVIESVERRAKIIRIRFANQENILIHLKMTGQLIYVDDHRRLGGGHPTEDWIKQLPSKHSRVILHLADVGNADLHSLLFFNDQRLFGWLKVMSDQEVEKEFAKYGPDVNTDKFQLEQFANRIKSKSQPIKLTLLDHTIVAGIGNIYACDILHISKIAPTRPSKSLTKKEVEALFTFSKEIINKGIELGGTTFDGKYVNIDGMAGGYQKVARVYGRAGEACIVCGTAIVKDRLGGRGTYWCTTCQI